MKELTQVKNYPVKNATSFLQDVQPFKNTNVYSMAMLHQMPHKLSKLTLVPHNLTKMFSLLPHKLTHMHCL